MNDNLHDTDLDRIRREIAGCMNEWKQREGVDFWREPLVACASACDPLFETLKEVVDPSHATPRDILPEARSVIVFFLPFRPEFGRENDSAGFHASRNWAVLYYRTNDLIRGINEHLQNYFTQAGYKSRITPATHNFDEKKLVSLWSHKHLGYIAGLGTFGMNHLLITPAGCCGRLGSLVTSVPITPTQRPGRELCLEKSGRECLGCYSKCVYGGLKPGEEFDRQTCYAQCLANDSHFDDLPLVDVCGKCSCEVPCSYHSPA
ncbi:MAG: epoxyqueuosine reductase [Syntrophobacteraceae bacterium]